MSLSAYQASPSRQSQVISFRTPARGRAGERRWNRPRPVFTDTRRRECRRGAAPI